jgi:hypothetical protein
MFTKENLINKLTLDLVTPFIPNYTGGNAKKEPEVIQESIVVEPELIIEAIVTKKEIPAPTQNFFDPIQDKQLDLNISSEPTRVDYYKDHIKNVVPSDFKVEKHKDKIVVTPTPKQQNLENNPEFKELLVSLTMYMMDQINIEPLPDLIFVEDDVNNAKDMLGRTAHYNHNDKTITLYTCGRHPKDILRSYAHEMIHHKQNLEGRLKNKINTQNINEDDYLKEIEEEAYRLGNGLLFREWENSTK